MGKKSFVKRYIAYPLEALAAYIIFYFFKLLPLDWASWFGGKLMRFVGPHLKVSKQVVLFNFTHIMPDLTEQERRELLLEMWEHVGRVIGEYPHLMDIAEDATRVEWKGYDYLMPYIQGKNRKPVMLLAGHIGNWELLPVMTSALKMKTTMIYRAPNNPYVDALIRRARHVGSYMKLVNKGKKGARALISALKRKEIIGMLIDQKMDDGIEAHFLGQPAMSPSAAAEFAIKYKADILFSRSVRVKGTYFRIEVSEPQNAEMLIASCKGKSHKEQVAYLTQYFNDHLSFWIKENPSQWLWTHRRWTSRVNKVNKNNKNKNKAS